MTPVTPSAGSRLCAACGMCCNGVLFHYVRLQPEDSPQKLVALGLKLKRKKKQHHLRQPCPAFRESQCAIYPDRPTRCHLFECRQLKGLLAGKISEAAALKTIQQTLAQLEQLSALFQRAGDTNEKRPLTKRYETLLAEPLDASSSAAAIKLRQELGIAMQQLKVRLDVDFRT